MHNIVHKTFAEIDLQDPFFQSLRDDYVGFDEWFRKKYDQDAFVQYDDNHEIIGFLYLKVEENLVDDIVPIIQAKKILKVGTFKIEAHGTKMGEQFIKIISDYAVSEQVDVCYVTIFEKHASLINLVQQFGFDYYGTKGNGAKKENVYLKQMRMTGDINKDFPLVNSRGVKKYLLCIYPNYHSIMFPDSILTTENKEIIKDVSYTNSIHKIYVCTMRQVENLKYGDIVVVYRTAEDGRYAEYSSVATSVCVVEEVKKQDEFSGFDKFYEYACKYSVFDREDLHKWYNKGGCKTIKMTYNGAFKKRIVRHDLANSIGLDRNEYWGCMELTDEQFQKIVTIGEVAGLIF